MESLNKAITEYNYLTKFRKVLFSKLDWNWWHFQFFYSFKSILIRHIFTCLTNKLIFNSRLHKLQVSFIELDFFGEIICKQKLSILIELDSRFIEAKGTHSTTFRASTWKKKGWRKINDNVSFWYRRCDIDASIDMGVVFSTKVILIRYTVPAA